MKKRNLMILGILFIASVPVWCMILSMMSGALMSGDEMLEKAGSVFANLSGRSKWSLFPQYPTIESIKTLLLDTPGFYVTFWNSYIQVLSIILIQTIIGIPAAWGMGRFDFTGKRMISSLYVVLMLIPFQVMMLSEYMVLSKFHLMNTPFAVILPAGFSTMSVVIMSRFFQSIPEDIIEAARIDGANEIKILLRIGMPIAKGGVVSTLLLIFLEQYNAVERPMNFLKDKTLWPLSIYLPIITEEKLSVAFVAALVTMLPCILLFFTCNDQLEQGIAATGLKA